MNENQIIGYTIIGFYVVVFIILAYKTICLYKKK